MNPRMMIPAYQMMEVRPSESYDTTIDIPIASTLPTNFLTADAFGSTRD